MLGHRSEIGGDHGKRAVPPPAQPGKHRMLAVVAVDPGEAAGFEILFVQGRQAAIEVVEVGGQALQTAVPVVGEQPQSSSRASDHSRSGRNRRP